MVSTASLTIYLLEAILSHLALSCALLLSTLAVIRWYIRDSYKVDGFSQKHVFITGCDSGFGNLLARQLDRKGFHVMAACLTEKGATDLATAASPRLKTLMLNVTDSATIRRAVEFVSKEVGERGLWGLVNNAGRSVPIGPTDWMQLEDFTKVLDVNLIGVIEVTLQFLPLLKKAHGRVVNTASILGRLSLTGGGYCLSKWGVEAFSDSLRRDMQHFGIKVSIIEPGFFKTGVTRLDLIEADQKRLWTRLPQDVKDSYGDTYLDDYVKAQEFSMGILCSPDISKVTRCMEHALTARFPRTRYGAGWDAKFFGFLCPTSLLLCQTLLSMRFFLYLRIKDMSNRPDTELNSMTDNFVKTIKYIVTKVLLKSVKTVLQNRKCINFMSQQQQFKPYMGML